MLTWIILYITYIGTLIGLARVIAKTDKPVKIKKRQISLLEHNLNYIRNIS